jgi:zinc protease
VKEKELAISVQVFVTKNRYPGLLVIELVLQKGVDPADVSLALDTEMERLIREGISDEEIARARRQCLAELVYRREYPEDLGFYLGESAVITGDPEYLNRYSTLLSSLTAEDLVRIAGKYLIPEKRTVVAITPKPTLN